jgi:hypothetical protein
LFAGTLLFAWNYVGAGRSARTGGERRPPKITRHLAIHAGIEMDELREIREGRWSAVTPPLEIRPETPLHRLASRLF